MKTETQEFFKRYKGFCDEVTSVESQDSSALVRRIHDLEQNDSLPVARLMTAGFGLSAESGEFTEIVKKIVFQGKPYNEDERFHMKRELGDVCWYMMQACIALDLDPVDIIEENIRKLEKRYKDGKFDVYHSENREEGDI